MALLVSKVDNSKQGIAIVSTRKSKLVINRNIGTKTMTTNIETLRRICPTCEACCGLVIKVDRDAQKIVSIQGDPDDHRSKGWRSLSASS